MTDLPYTDADLRTEAARLLAIAARDADDRIRPAVQRKWEGQASPEVIDEACDELVSLLDRAANLSDWAVNLGADGLEPLPEQLSAQTGDGPWFRLHFAVRPDMPDDMRRALVEGVGAEIAKHFPNN